MQGISSSFSRSCASLATPACNEKPAARAKLPAMASVAAGTVCKVNAWRPWIADRARRGNRMSQEIIDARALGRVHRQKAIFKIPHQQTLTFECPPDPLTNDANEDLKRGQDRRRYSAKGQPLAR